MVTTMNLGVMAKYIFGRTQNYENATGKGISIDIESIGSSLLDKNEHAKHRMFFLT